MGNSIKSKIILPTIATIAVVVAVFVLIIYAATSNNVNENGRAIAESIKVGIENAVKSKQISEKIMEDEMVAQSVMVSYMIEKGTTHEDLKEIAKRGGIDEIWSTDDKGNTTLTSVAPKVDFNFGADPNGQAAEYMQLLKGDVKTVTQPAQARDIDDAYYKFVGVGSWNPDKPKIVQVGRNGQKLVALEQEIGVANYMTLLKSQLNKTVLYAAILDENGKVVAATKDTDMSAIGFTAEYFKNGNAAEFGGSFEGTKVMNYVKPLSNGQYLAISVTNDILTFITWATIIAGTIAISIILLILSITIGRQVKRILNVRDALDDISQGEADLTKRMEVNSHDEIGQLLVASNGLMDYFQGIIQSLQIQSSSIHASTEVIYQLADQTLASSHQIEHGASAIEKAAQSQMTSTTESAIAMEELAHSIQHVTDSIMQMANAIRDTELSADTGVQVVNALLQQLKEVYEKTAESVKRSEELAVLSNKIAEFTNMITAISDQTNLLALNASIEAARAGDAGKGFAVVAEEVRKLAEESKTAADRITNVMVDVQRETEEIVGAVHETANVLKQGQEVANKAQESFYGITTGVRNISSQVDAISSASEEIAASTEEISATFEDVTLLSQQTVKQITEMVSLTNAQYKGMSEMAKSVDSLFEISDQLNSDTGKYKIQ